MRRSLGLLITAMAATLGLVALPAVALADGSGPTIESESVVHVGSTDAALQAWIGTAGVEHGTVYQFQVVANPSEYSSEIVCPETSWWLHPWLSCGTPTAGALPIGLIPSFPMVPAASTPVFVDLAATGMKLKPDTTYHYRVLAAQRVPSEDTLEWESPPVYGPDQTFTTPTEGKAPVIESVGVSHLTATDATLEATIDTEGLETEYAFHLWSSPCSKKGSGCELVIPIKLPCCGKLYGSSVPQTVSLDLGSAGVALGEGEYGFSVRAWNEAGSTIASGGVFEAPGELVAEPLGSGGSTATPLSAGGDETSGSQTPSPSPSSSPSSTSKATGGASGSAKADLVRPTRHVKAKPRKPKRKKHKSHKVARKAWAGRRR